MPCRRPSRTCGALEGAHGWAETLPTWYRRTTPAGRAFARVVGGRPLTGYHLFMLPTLLLALHFPLLAVWRWSLSAELETIATFLVFAIVWDFLWFLLNPAYGLTRFRRGLIWWYGGPWLGRVPSDYAIGIGASLVLAALAGTLAAHARLTVAMVVLDLLVIPLAPAYMRWYRSMRAFDERDRAGIAPPPDENG